MKIYITLLIVFRCLTFDIKKNNNLVGYWGQNSFGNVKDADLSKGEQSLNDYCNDSTYDVLAISFLTKFNGEIFAKNKSDNVSKESVKTMLMVGKNCIDDKSCELVKQGIKTCQQKGKLVLLSIGGYSKDYSLESENEANNFAKFIWDYFLGGESKDRPFGDVKLDGVDLDIENGNPRYYPKFIEKLKLFYDSKSKDKRYYVTAAPQCPFPDASLSPTLESSHLDMVFVQFYNNPSCDIKSKEFNYQKWDEWATSKSLNKNVKLFIGLPASSSAATTGYIEHSDLKESIRNVSSKYASFGGIMLWDVSQASQNICKDIKKPYGQAMSHLLKETPNNKEVKKNEDSYNSSLFSKPKFMKKQMQSPDTKQMKNSK